jgi:hypothetical protein
MLVVITTEPTTFVGLDINSCVPLAADESLAEVNQCTDIREFLVESGIAPPPSAGLWVLECDVEKVEEDAPEGLRATLVKWRHPTHEEIDGILVMQGSDSMERSRKIVASNGCWTVRGSMF